MLMNRQPIATLGVMGGVWAVPTEFCWSLAQTIQYSNEYLCEPGQYLHLDIIRSSYHESARNALAQRFIGDFIVMLDTDHSFEPDIIARMVGLIKAYDVDVLTAMYRYKEGPYLPNLFWFDEASGSFPPLAEIDMNAPLYQIKASGAGCLLVRRKVFDQIRAELKQEPFDIMPSDANPKKNLSEDFSFYRRCMRLGIKTYVAPQIYSYHLRAHAVANEDYDRSAVQTMPLPSGGEIAVKTT